MELAQYLYSQITSGQLDESDGRRYLGEVVPSEIAVVGMSCEYTGADSVFDLEEMLRSGRNGFKPFPDSRKPFFPRDHRYLVDGAKMAGRDAEELFQAMCDQPGAYLDDVDQFEPGFFDIAEGEATYIDPMHRLVLKHLHLAIEHSGMTREEITGSRTAVYVGKDRSIAGSYASEIEADSDQINPGTWEGILASRLNYLYDLQGGSLVVDTACSSSLVALHIARKMLRDNEIDIALVGGIALGMAPRQGEVFGDYASVETSRDHLKVFDRASSGTIFGEGVGFVMLRRLPDAIEHGDKVYSLVRATGINSDGRSNGLTAPNPKAQTALVQDTYAAAAISPATIDYVDAHGTGTKLGDPIEIRGLTDAFRGAGMDAYSTCALSSLKENIGHTVGAAGVGGLIKMSLALDSALIYPASGFEVPNDFIKFIDTPFFVPDRLTPWQRGDHPRRGAISSFGFSGTNGHAVLEEYVAAPRAPQEERDHAFLLSAPTLPQLRRMIEQFLHHEQLVRENPIADIAYTLTRRRRRYASSGGFVATDHDGFFAGLRGLLARIDGSSVDGVVLHTAEPSDGAATPASPAVEMIRRRIQDHPDLFGLAERLELEVVEGGGLIGDADFPGAQVCGLPGHVFDTRSYWGTVKTYNVYDSEPAALPGVPVEGQLLDTRIVSSPTTDLYAVPLDTDRWFLSDHRIAGSPTLSGTAYTQLAAEIATLHFGTPRYKLTKMMFQNLIQVTGPRTVLVEVTRGKGSDGRLSVVVFSQTDDAQAPFVTHGSFTIEPLAAGEIDEGPGDRAPGAEVSPMAWSDEEENSSGMRFAGRWDLRINRMLHDTVSERDHLLEFTIAEQFTDDLADFHISPAVLDLVAGAISWERSVATGRTFLPLSYGSLRYTGRPFTRTIRSRTALHYDPAGDPQVAVADVWIYDEHGELIIQLERYAMRAFAAADQRPIETHQVVLEAAPMPAGELPGSVLVIDPQPGDLPAELAAISRRITPAELPAEQGKVDLIVQVVREPAEPSGFEEALRQHFDLAREVPRHLVAGGSHVLLTAAGLGRAGDPVHPFEYAALAAARVVQLENPRITTVALSDTALDLGRAARLGGAPELAGRKALVSDVGLSLEAVRSCPPPATARNLPAGSTVLVTGAFGGIGAEYLAALWQDHGACAIVLGRRDLDELEASALEDDRNRAARIRELLADGMPLRFVRCDLADPDAVRATAQALQAEGVTVDGLVHLAGVPEDGMLFRKTWDDLRAVVAPKALAAAVLADVLRPRFVVAASSMTTVVGAPGQFGYTFANAYLEGLAHGTGTVSVVRWPGWKETGMATRFGVADAADDSFLIRSLGTSEGARYVRHSLRHDFTDVIAGEFTGAAGELLTPWLQYGDPDQPSGTNPPTESMTGSATDSTAAEPTGPAIAGDASEAEQHGISIMPFESLAVTGADRPLDDVEKFVTVLFASVLERSDIDVRTSFTDMGGDSLKAFSIYTPLVDQFQVDLEVADIFIHSTVLELGAHVRSMQDQAA